MSEIKYWRLNILSVITGNIVLFFDILDLPVHIPFIFAYTVYIIILTFNEKVQKMLKSGHENDNSL